MCRFLFQPHPRLPRFQALMVKGHLSRISPMEMVGTAYCAVKSQLQNMVMGDKSYQGFTFM